MFSVGQKRNIANSIQQILRDPGHPEVPVTEIEFMLHVHGRFQWSWADIQNNSAVPTPSVNPWNEAQDKTPAEPQHGREPEKVKPLAQYLGEYVEHEVELGNIHISCQGIEMMSADYDTWGGLLEQALDAYESTEQVKIRIERI